MMQALKHLGVLSLIAIVAALSSCAEPPECDCGPVEAPQSREDAEAYDLALMLQSRQEYQASLHVLDWLRVQNPNFPDTEFAYGFALHQLGHFDAAAAEYTAYLQRHPADTQVWLNLGHVKTRQADCLGATRAFDRALSLEPTLVQTHLWMAECFEATGQSVEAERARALYQAGISE
ncbi:MAG: tetratricopeptide repeat protein [Myxococcales bacterium]|nr:tetratricopeptide repeat protein [Myxococcales bacterium]